MYCNVSGNISKNILNNTYTLIAKHIHIYMTIYKIDNLRKYKLFYAAANSNKNLQDTIVAKILK